LAAAFLAVREWVAVACDPGLADDVVPVIGLACPGEDSISAATTATAVPPAPTATATGQRRRGGGAPPAPAGAWLPA
jgi:hypothetical protein